MLDVWIMVLVASCVSVVFKIAVVCYRFGVVCYCCILWLLRVSVGLFALIFACCGLFCGLSSWCLLLIWFVQGCVLGSCVLLFLGYLAFCVCDVPFLWVWWYCGRCG